MLESNYKDENPELIKLISFGYDLHKKGLDDFGDGCELFPRLYSYNNYSYKTKRVKDGIVWGRRGYSNHSSCEVYTNLGLTVGEIKDRNLIFDYAIMFGIDNQHGDINICLFEPKDDSRYEPALEAKFIWNELSEDERISIFVKSMVSIGFNKEDVLNVISGKMSAREAYMNVASEEDKHIQWVDYGRRHFEFYDNIAIDGHFGNVSDIDDFPFPFEGEVIFDCSKCKTACINLSDNKRRVRLINVNENRDSLKYANIRNAIIDEVINLSKVDAYDTVFGHHKVCGFEYSIAKIDTMDLTLATDMYGNKLKVDEKGKAEVDYFGDPTLVEESTKVKPVQVLANVDDTEMIKLGAVKDTYGVGLVRMETFFYKKEQILKFLPLLVEYEPDEEILEEFKREYSKFLKELFESFKEQRIVIRLFDFRFIDILKNVAVTDEDLQNVYYSYFDRKTLMKIRGARYLCANKDFLREIVKLILEVVSQYDREIDILVPYLEREWDLVEIREVIEEENENVGVQYRYGAMIENLTSVANADKISKRVDFVSIGLNDLTEDVTGKSRESECKEFYYLSDEVKECIKEIIYRVKAVSGEVSIGVCGEHVNYLENLEFLSQIGIDYISVNPSNILRISEILGKDSSERKLSLTRLVNGKNE